MNTARQCDFDVKFQNLRNLDPIDNMRPTWPGLNVPNVLGQVGAGGTEEDATTLTFSRMLIWCTFAKMKAYKKEIGSCLGSSKYHRNY